MKPLSSDRTGDHVAAIWRVPFSEGAATIVPFEAGASVAEMVARMEFLPADFAARGHVLIDGHVLARQRWSRIRPKAGRKVTMHYPLAGGGESGKQALALVVAVATILTAGWAAAGGASFLGASFAAGELGAKMLAAGISLAGSLAASALTPPPTAPDMGGAAQQQRGPAAVQGNLLAANAPIARVIGQRWIYPALACQPLIARVGPDEVAEAVFVLAGPHDISRVRVGDVEIEDAEDVEYQVREGWASDEPQTLVFRYGATSTVAIQMSAHRLSGENRAVLEEQGDPGDCLPKWHSASSSAGADEIWLHLTLPAGLFNSDDRGQKQFVPIRIRIRAGARDEWINLPELHYASNDAQEVRPSIVLKWARPPSAIPAVPATDGWRRAYKRAPGQAAPETDAWEADASFSAGAGNDGLYAGAEGTTNVRRVTLDAHQATIWLDEAAIPKTGYQIEIKRGQAVDNGAFTQASYQTYGTVYDLFHYYMGDGGARVLRDMRHIVDRLHLVRVTSVWNQHPIAGGRRGHGLAVIAVKATNREVQNLSCLAAGYVRDWDGTGWNEWTTTSNPAPHYVDVLRGDLSPDPLPAELLDSDVMVAWRQRCIDNGHTCDLVVEGDKIDDLLGRIAGCGYARPAASEVWGVVMDYDRSSEEPVQIFTARNSADLSMSKAFVRMPDAFRCIYRAADDLDKESELLVYRPGREGALAPRVEELRIDGLVHEEDVHDRALFDLAQAEARSAFWGFRAATEAIVCRRGDLIGVNHDVLDRTHASARVTDVEMVDGMVTAIWLDAPVQVHDEPDMHGVADMLAVEDMHAIGLSTSIRVRKTDGLFVQRGVFGPGGLRRRLAVRAFAPEFDADGRPTVREDCLAWIGQPGSIDKRLIVAGVTYDGDMFATISAIPEAPELFPPAMGEPTPPPGWSQ